MQEREPFLQRLHNHIWLWLLLSNLIFFVVYLIWGVLDIFRIPAR
ncbi:MAG: hypothetical protein QN198_07810 [Armatimonadota bacterium]|nr:hypothetical protein [Armatimonadota bacterium]MDR5703493.1 hypothetical protein [Armatimonadota bacterium]MDR7435916.1 hypothetical protein [Armatimonadota bacterium]